MRYYVTTAQGEQGPYEETHVRGWLREGTMPRDALVRLENEAAGAPAASVFPGEAPALQSSANPWQSSAYVPPLDTGGTNDWVHLNEGNFAAGFVFGFFCGCIALIASYTVSSMGSETKRGVRIGFAVGLGISALGRVMIEVMH